MLIRVEQGKGMKDRYTLLSPRLLAELRRYYRVYRPTEWLFADRRRDAPIDPRSAERIYQRPSSGRGSARRAGFTRCYENGVHRALLRGSDAARAKILFKGQGNALPDLALPFPLPPCR